jgi:hypothetical protein
MSENSYNRKGSRGKFETIDEAFSVWFKQVSSLIAINGSILL